MARTSIRLKADRNSWGRRGSPRPTPLDRMPRAPSRIPAAPRSFGPKRVEDRLAKRLGFNGQSDPNWRFAKSMLRRGKLVASILDDVAEQVSSENLFMPQRTEGSCAYATGNSPVAGFVSAAGSVCVQGQAASLSQTVTQAMINSGFAHAMGADTNPGLPGPWQVEYTFATTGMSVGQHLGPTPINTTRSWLREALDPMARPIGQIEPAFRPEMPFRMLPYVRHGQGQSPQESSARSHDKLTLGVARPAELNAYSLELSLALGPVIRPHIRTKPPAGTRERKSIVQLPSVVARAFNAVTETGDAVESFYDALPDRIKNRERARRHGKDPKLVDQMSLVYRYWYEVDLQQAVINLITNQIEDYVIGKLSKRANRINRRMGGRPVGVTFGPAL